MISTSHRWRKTALASLVAAVFGLYGSNASALALGRITVQSALGDPLRAEIDIPEINAEEAASLRPAVASPDAFRAAGLEYNQALTGVQISLQRRPDGRAFLRLTSDRAVSEPFVDLILEATWSSGRLVRDYTLLLDPPNLRATLPAQPALPQTAPVQIAPAPAVTALPPATSAPSRTAQPAAPATRPPSPAAAPRTPAPGTASPAGDRNLVVQRGDTAGAIASANKPPQVSLDQMLVALLRNNESAFINGNLNRLKAGAVINLPSEEQARAVPQADARRLVVAHSRDFNEFRSQLAANAPSQQVASASRAAGGSVQAQVQDGRGAAPTPDRLTLSQGGVQGQQAAAIAQSRAAQDVAQRTAEAARNIEALRAASAAASAAVATVPAPTPAPAPAETAQTGSTPAPVGVAAIPAPTAAVSATPAESSSAASAPSAPPPRPTLPAPTPVADEEGMFDSLLANPLLLAAGGGLIVLLLALAMYKARQRRKSADVDSAFLESRLQPDSFFGASGGQRVDTAEAGATGSSMVYSPSQLDAADDVDPVAEADVYLAYGRDAQAEEILREALRTHPGRIAVHQKLLDIYAKRREAQNFEAIANEAYKLVGEGSQEWLRICEQGRSIDPANRLYQPGGQPADASGAPAVAALAASTVPLATSILATQKMDAVAPAAPASVDLDLDFSLDDLDVPSAIEEARPSQLEPTVAISPPPAVDSDHAPLDFDFGMATEPVTPPASAATAAMPVEVSLPDISKAEDTLALVNQDSDDFRHQAEVSFGSTSPLPLQTTSGGMGSSASSVDAPLPDVSFGYTTPSELTATQAPLNTPPAAADSGMLEFDLGTLSLELDEPAKAGAAADAPAEAEDPLATKLALAEEFVSIGDDEGARALIEEVIAEASGELQARAQRALSSLN